MSRASQLASSSRQRPVSAAAVATTPPVPDVVAGGGGLDKILECIQATIHAKRKQVEVLTAFLEETLRTNTVFDDEDAAQTKVVLEQRQAEVEKLTAMYGEATSLHAETVVEELKRLEARVALLTKADTETNVLSSEPSLCEYFARKHTEKEGAVMDLQQMLLEKIKSILTGVAWEPTEKP